MCKPRIDSFNDIPAKAFQALVRYYVSTARAWCGRLPFTDSELHAWAYRQLVLLWNAPTMVDATFGEFLSWGLSRERGGAKVATRGRMLAGTLFLTWPIPAAVITFDGRLTAWFTQWTIALDRPDLFLAVGRGPFTTHDRHCTPSSLLHFPVSMHHFTRRPSPSFAMDDKREFSRLCAAHDLDAIQVVKPNGVDPATIYIAKPFRSGQGRGVFLVKGLDVPERVNPATHLLQCRVDNHPQVRAIVGPDAGLCTLRIATLKPVGQRPQVFGALFRLARAGAVVDNWHAGGLACPVDLVSGVLKAGAMDERKQASWAGAFAITSHPDTGVPFAERFVIPDFDTAKRLCVRAHDVLGPDLVYCSWDVALGVAGPVLVEAASGLGGGLEAMHRVDYRAYLEALKHHVRAISA